MKKIYLITIVLFLILTHNVFGQTILPTKTDEAKEIQSLKEKIATKVAELREKNNKAVSGTVTEISGKKIKIKTTDEESFEIKFDSELTKFYQITTGQKKEIKFQDLKKGSYVIVTGVINDKIVEANAVYIDELFIVGSGKISEVNKEDFYIKVVTSEKENYTLDIETFSKQLIMNIKTLEIEKVGFSKIKEGDTIHFVVKKSGLEKEINRYAAQKVLILPQEYFIK